MSNRHPIDVYWTGGLDSETSMDSEGGCPMDIPWMSIGQVDWISYGSPLYRWTGQWDKPGQ